MAETVEITGLEERIKAFGNLATKNPVMQKRIREVIRKVLLTVRKALQNDAASGLQMNSDPRKAYKAVRMAVYRRIFGGQVNLLQSKRAGAGRFYAPPRNPSHRGGNRRTRSDRTYDIMSYQGSDRGFILRFLNQGTQNRVIRFKEDESRTAIHRGSRGGNVSKYGKTINTGNRGSISGRNWFGRRSQAEMESAAQAIDKLIDDIVQGIMY